MDPSYSINTNGFIYTPLSDEGHITSSGSPITSWPSYDGTQGYLVSQADYSNYNRHLQLQQHEFNLQHNVGFTVVHPDQIEQEPLSSFASSSLWSHISPLIPPTSSPLSISSSRHPLDLTPIDTKNLSISSMDLLHPSPEHLHGASTDDFGFNSNNLTSFLNIQSAATLSRSSSPTSNGCIDPAALLLKQDPSLMTHGTSTISASSCFSTPESRRLSSFSISGGLEEDTTFSDAISAYESARKNWTSSSSSNRSVPSTPDPSEGWNGCSVYAPDLMLADGTLLRFDGRSLVPALSTCSPIDFTVTDDSFVPSSEREIACPQAITLNPANLMHSNADISLMMPSYIPYAEFSQLGIDVAGQGSSSSMMNPTDPTLLSDSPPHNGQQMPVYSLTSTSSPLRPSVSSTDHRLKHKKTASLRKSAFEDRRRRGSTDSAYHSSSSSSSTTMKPRASSSSMSNSFDSNSNSNSNNSSSSNRYRKDGVGEFKCPFEGCDYHYNLRRELNRHRNVHVFAGRDKYRCMNCNSGLCRLDSVKRHMEAKGKSECLKRGLYQEFREDGELARVRHCKPSWYEGAAAVAAAAAAASAAALEARRRRK
ncbi:hypothetical protein EMPS_01790 [Entomortierella parvispora]|uniref:C2H2-type domain-containing protein n=1 Tax=Entomortierella parvispora TaxID=205924 RepID=A0A9P3LT00_9FUNG|nr:hypothetical protein EMPS_01790 [Entomortierella parvispora]